LCCPFKVKKKHNFRIQSHHST